MDELVIGDKTYISSKRAASITGYAKDYVGQLCREGHVEAKMVGRSWYVLESSIRAHRFGEESKEKQISPEEAPQIAETPAPRVTDTWTAPKYVPEVAPVLPAIAPGTALEPYEEEDHALATQEETESLTEMQAAWKEWFETKQVEPTSTYIKEEEPVQVPEPVEEVEKEPEEAVPVPVHRIAPIRPSYPGKMDIAPVQAAVQAPIQPIPTKRAAKHRARHQTGSNLIATTLLIAFAGIVIAVAYIGSGLASPYLGSNPVFDFLGGTSSIQK